MWGIEAQIRNLAKACANSYQIAFLACSREVLSAAKHCGGFESKQAASAYYLK